MAHARAWLTEMLLEAMNDLESLAARPWDIDPHGLLDLCDELEHWREMYTDPALHVRAIQALLALADDKVSANVVAVEAAATLAADAFLEAALHLRQEGETSRMTKSRCWYSRKR